MFPYVYIECYSFYTAYALVQTSNAKKGYENFSKSQLFLKTDEKKPLKTTLIKKNSSSVCNVKSRLLNYIFHHIFIHGTFKNNCNFLQNKGEISISHKRCNSSVDFFALSAALMFPLKRRELTHIIRSYIISRKNYRNIFSFPWMLLGSIRIWSCNFHFLFA